MLNADAFKGRRILVTGATGFKGSWLCNWLLSLGADVYGLSLAPDADAPLFGQLSLGERMHHTDGDIRDAQTVERAFDEARPEMVFHLAAQSLVRESYNEPKLTFDTNIGGSVNMLEAVRKSDELRALVYVTSDKCYRNKEHGDAYTEDDELGGRDPYSASKAAAEIVFSAYLDSFLAARDNLGAASARAGNVIGGGDLSKDRIIPDCVRALGNEKPIGVRNPNAVRPWQHVLEPLSGYLLVAQKLMDDPVKYSGSWNFGPANEDTLPVSELVNMVVDVWGAGEVLDATQANAPHEAGLLMLDSQKARTQLGWHPQWDCEHAVRHTVQWYKAVGEGADPRQITDQQTAAYVGWNT